MFDGALLAIPPGPGLAAALAGVEVDALDGDATLIFLQAVRRQQAWTESLTLVAVAHFAESNHSVPDRPLPGAEQLIPLGGDGTPRCGSFTADELGPELRVSCYSAARLIADALDLTYRLPGVLKALRMGGTDAYRARLVASRSRMCSQATAARVEDRVRHRLDRLSRYELVKVVEETLAVAEPELLAAAAAQMRPDRHVTVESSCGDHVDVWARMAAGAAIRLDARVDQVADMLGVVHPELGETKDQRRARALGLLADPHAVLALTERHHQIGGSPKLSKLLPATTLYVHVRPEGFAELERFGVVSMTSLADLFALSHVTIKPVIDLAHMNPSAGYRPSDSLREGIIVATPTCPFPYCDSDARNSQLDHTIHWPRGHTEADNLGPPCPRHHNVKTHGAGWELQQPFRGIFVWRSPTGRVYVTDGREALAIAA